MVRWMMAVSVLSCGLIGCVAPHTSQAPRPLTPESVAREINGSDLEGVRRVWYKIGAERPGVPGRRPDVFKVAGRPGAYGAGPFSAQVFRVDLDGSTDGITGAEGGSDAVVRIGDGAGWDWQFLAFMDSPDGWRYAGSVELPENRVGAPVPEVRTLGPGLSWLVVRTYRQATRPLTEQEMVWHQVRDGRLVEVLRAPVEGHRMGSTTPFDVVYRAEVLDVFLTPENRPAVTVNVEAVYSNARREAFPGLTELFRRTGVVRYVQDRATGRFTLDAGSEWSAEELAGLLTESADQFVHNNRVQLVELSQSGDGAKRQWVSRLRRDCASDEVRRELTALVEVETAR